eukprot:COSAG02_NODE_6663_length_3432_cov_2.297930_2_plen_228_part_00
MILENVRGLLTLDSGGTLATILRGIRAIGYCVDYTLLNSATVLAQHRERLYFVCVRADLVERRRDRQPGSVPTPSAADFAPTSSTAPKKQVPCFKFPWPELPDLHRKVGDVLEPEEAVPASLSLDEHRWAKISNSSYYAKHPTARVAELGAKAQTVGSSYKRGWALYSQFVPVPPCAALDSGSGRQLPRFFTPREVARLQGFPESFVLDGLDAGRLYHQLGNAVSRP